MTTTAMFDQYIGIDYSGANTPVARLNGLAVYRAGRDAMPGIVLPQRDHCDLWSRKLLAQWLVKTLADCSRRTLVGVDLGFGFPIAYFEQYPEIPQDNWEWFLRDFRAHWPTDGDDALVRVIRDNPAQLRGGNPTWLRMTDQHAQRQGHKASSVFDFRAKARNVAHSTHAGLPWLLYIRHELRRSGIDVHFWPFDDWKVADGRSVILEVYPSLWNREFRRATRGLSGDRRDAYSLARWMAVTDQANSLRKLFEPGLSEEEKIQARTEGWIFGVMAID